MAQWDEIIFNPIWYLLFPSRFWLVTTLLKVSKNENKKIFIGLIFEQKSTHIPVEPCPQNFITEGISLSRYFLVGIWKLSFRNMSSLCAYGYNTALSVKNNISYWAWLYLVCMIFFSLSFQAILASRAWNMIMAIVNFEHAA